MKLFIKPLCLTVALLMVCSSLSFTVLGASSTDDGVLQVIAKNSKKYLGTVKSDFCTEFVPANGEGNSFFRYKNIDVNGDAKSDIADLVALNNNIQQNSGSDLNFDLLLDAHDLAIMRQTLIGINDFEIK